MKWFISVSSLLAIFAASAVALSVNPTGTRIIGGREAETGQFPYQAALRIKIVDRDNFGTCGGTLIAADYTLTAAHCVRITGVEHIQVHLGAQDIANTEEPGRLAVIVGPEGFFAHENYDSTAISNDIALLKFPEKIEFTDRIQPCSLPRRSDANINLEGKFVISSGWGRYSDAESSISPVLKYMVVPVESQKICRHFYGNIELVTESNICTYTGSGDGVCNGDSGGPLAHTDATGHMTVIGVTSFVSDIGCVQSGWPSVFVRVTSFLDWIAANSDIVIES